VQECEPLPVCGRGLDRGFEQTSPEARTAPLLEHGHPTDLARGQQACTADRLACLGQREDVDGALVFAIPFQLPGDTLFLDEHLLTHGAQPILMGRPGHDCDMDVHGERRASSGAKPR
jgi:hypothetical protein